MDDRIQMRVDILAKEIPGPSTSEPDEISAALHAVAVGLVDLGGVKVLENAAAVIRGVAEVWPTKHRPIDAEVLKEAAWSIRQDPINGTEKASATCAPLRDRIEDAISGRLVAVPWPWASLGGNTQALLPGAITILVGSPGASKSFMLFQAALWWIKEGWTMSVYALEEDPAFWLNRALALLSGIGMTTDPAWLATHPDLARGMLAEHRAELDQLANQLTCAPPQGLDLRGLAEWIAAEAKAGKRIICADPITAASVGGGKPWLAAEDFMLRAKRTIVEHGASLVITSHGRKGDIKKGPPDLDSLSGGAAYARFASTVLWLEACDPETVCCTDADGRERFGQINRRLRILKARSGRGTGLTLGLHFDGASLRTTEVGVLIPGSPAPKPDARHQRERLRQPPQESEDLFKDAQ